jgi:chaperone modulatory protein CbpM
MQTAEFLAAAQLEPRVLNTWVEVGWLTPERESDDGYSEIDIARAGLIRDLQRMGVNDDSMVIILNLIDQVHGLRRVARTLLAQAVVQSGRTG